MTPAQARRILNRKLKRGRPPKAIAERRALARRVLALSRKSKHPRKKTLKSKSSGRKRLCPPKKSSFLQFTDLNIVGADCLDFVRQAGHEPGDCLGCGAVGCVVQTSGNKVIKITPDPVEANLAQWLLEQGNPHPVFPKIYQVLRLPPECQTKQGRKAKEYLWVIVREDIPSFTDSQEAQQISAFVLDDLEILALKNKLDLDDVTDIIDHYPGASQELAQQAAEGFHWAYEQGFTVKDLHDENLGLRSNEQLVFRDFGFAASKQHNLLKKIPALGKNNNPPSSKWKAWAKAIVQGKPPGF